MNKALRTRLQIPVDPYGLTEAQMTRAIMQQLRAQEWQMPGLAFVLHVPNEGKRSNVGGYLAKLGGLTPGVPDLIHFMGPPLFGLELKVKDNVPSPAQSYWLHHMQARGVAIGLAYTQDEAVQFVLGCFESKPAGLANWRAYEWLNHMRDIGQGFNDPRHQ